jgi:hypothetical protein
MAPMRTVKKLWYFSEFMGPLSGLFTVSADEFFIFVFIGVGRF